VRSPSLSCLPPCLSVFSVFEQGRLPLPVVPVSTQIEPVLVEALARVEARFERQLRSDLPPVARLCRHIEGYRGKMLRPRLVLVCGMASGSAELSDSHITAAAVCEMIHMATLVHDDVLDEAETRRRGTTVNGLHGNETAVILGDYLIAAAYHLCSQLDSQRTALLVAHVAMTLCAGELLQLSHRAEFSLDEPTYFEIIERKTAALVALSCRLGAMCSGADEGTAARMDRFGRKLGLAFQIQDDLLDLTGRQAVLGKPIGKDLGMGKLTLPVIHHLGIAGARERGRSLLLLEEAAGGGARVSDAAGALVRALDSTGSLAYARRAAEGLVAEAKEELAAVEPSQARDLLLAMSEAVVSRSS